MVYSNWQAGLWPVELQLLVPLQQRMARQGTGMQYPESCRFSGRHNWGPVCISCLFPAMGVTFMNAGSPRAKVGSCSNYGKTKLAYCVPVNVKSQPKLNHPFLRNDKKE